MSTRKWSVGLTIRIDLNDKDVRWSAYVKSEKELLRIHNELVHYNETSENDDEDVRRVGYALEFAESALSDGLPEQYTVHVTNNNRRARMSNAIDMQISSLLDRRGLVPVPEEWMPILEEE